jgi:LAO/AO transport system kinase
VVTCSALEKSGIEEIWNAIGEYLALTRQNGYFRNNRNRQSTYWMYETIDEHLRQHFYQQPGLKARIAELEKQVVREEISSFEAAQQLVAHYLKTM